MKQYTVHLWDAYSIYKPFVVICGGSADAVRAAVRRQNMWPEDKTVWKSTVPAGKLYQCGGLSALVVEGGEP